MSKRLGRPPRFNYAKVRAQLHANDWYLLGRGLPKTLYEAIRLGNIKDLQGVEVTIRHQSTDLDGKRHGDIYLRLKGNQ